MTENAWREIRIKLAVCSSAIDQVVPRYRIGAKARVPYGTDDAGGREEDAARAKNSRRSAPSDRRRACSDAGRRGTGGDPRQGGSNKAMKKLAGSKPNTGEAVRRTDKWCAWFTAMSQIAGCVLVAIV